MGGGGLARDGRLRDDGLGDLPGNGFFTPLHHIASVFVTPTALMSSMAEAAAGHPFALTVGPAVLGAVIHMMMGAALGIVFAVIASVARLRGSRLVLAGVLWGAVVFVMSSWVVLPLAAAVFLQWRPDPEHGQRGRVPDVPRRARAVRGRAAPHAPPRGVTVLAGIPREGQAR